MANFRIRFLKSSLPRLHDLIGKNLIPSMKYKLELWPRRDFSDLIGESSIKNWANTSPPDFRYLGEDIVRAISNNGLSCDVGSSHPGAVAGPKGWSVRPLKRYASWVQNVVRQFGLYPVQAFGFLKRLFSSTRRPRRGNPWCISCPQRALLSSYIPKW